MRYPKATRLLFAGLAILLPLASAEVSVGRPVSSSERIWLMILALHAGQLVLQRVLQAELALRLFEGLEI